MKRGIDKKEACAIGGTIIGVIAIAGIVLMILEKTGKLHKGHCCSKKAFY